MTDKDKLEEADLVMENLINAVSRAHKLIPEDVLKAMPEVARGQLDITLSDAIKWRKQRLS